MAVLTAPQLVELRAHPHKSKFYLALQVPRYMLYAQVNDGAAAQGDQVITYDNPTWNTDPDGGNYTHTDIKSGMTLYVGTAQGLSDMGRVRIKAADATTITVAENDHIVWADDIWLMVANIHEPWSIFPRVILNDAEDDVLIYQDYDIAYTDQATTCAPVAVMGPPAVGFLSGGTFTAAFDGSDSYGLDGASISSYSWHFPAGTPNTSAVATPGNVSWTTAGTYMVSLTVTDDNGKTHTGYRWVRVYDGPFPADGEYPYSEFDVDSLEGSYADGGWRAAFTLRDSRLGPTVIRDNGYVVLFADGEGDLPIPGNHPNRNNLLFVGWIVGETIRKDPLTNEVYFECSGVCERMKELEQFPDTFEIPVSGTAAKWYELENMTVDLLIAVHMKWRSTILEITDVHLTGDTAKAVMREDMTHGDLYGQCQKLMDAIVGKMASDKQSCIYCRVDPLVLPAGAERAAIDTLFTLADTDWGRGDIEFEKRNLDEVSQIDAAGVYHDGGTDPDVNAHPILSLAPGTAPRYEGRYERVEGLVLEGQAQANQLAGDILDWRNNEFPMIRIPMAGMWTPIDIAPPEWIQWTIAASYTKRGFSWTNARFLPRTVSIEVLLREGTAFVTIELEKETDGEDGITPVYPPTEPTAPTEPQPYTPPTPPTPPVPEEPPAGTWRKHVLACGDDGPYYTENFVSNGGPGGTPDWAQKIGGMGADINCKCLAFHPIEPHVTHYVLTANNVYRREPGVSDNWAVMLTSAQAQTLVGGSGGKVFHTMQSSPVWPDYLYVVFQCGVTTNAPIYLLRSVDKGVTWTNHGNMLGSFLYPANGVSELQIDQSTGLRMYIGFQRRVLDGYVLLRSDNEGVTWVDKDLGDVSTIPNWCINHYNMDIVYGYRVDGGDDRVYITWDAGDTLTPTANQNGWYPKMYSSHPGKHSFNSQKTLPGLVRVCSGPHMHKSLDFGVTWTRVTAGGAYDEQWNIEVVPDAVDNLYLHNNTGGGAAQVGATQDEGATTYNKDGVGGTAIGGSIVDLTPIWTLE